MLLPTTATAVWVALLVSLICWGSWAAFFKGVPKARFEFFAYDFAWGAVLASVLAAFTLGSWNSHDLTFQDNLILISGRKMLVGFAGGMVFNLANILLLGSIAVSGLSVAFPIVFGLTWSILAVWNFMSQPSMNPMLSIGGAIVILISVVLNVLAYRWYLANLQSKEAPTDPRKSPPRSSKILKAVGLAFLSALCMVLFFALLDRATVIDTGLVSYSAALFISAGIFISCIMFVPFFLNFPVKGQPLSVRRYFKIDKRHHSFGVLAGMTWTAGLLAGLITDGLPAEIRVSPVVVYMLGHLTPVLAALWGLLVWRETAGAPTRVQMMMAATLVLLVAGMGLVAIAPTYGH